MKGYYHVILLAFLYYLGGHFIKYLECCSPDSICMYQLVLGLASFLLAVGIGMGILSELIFLTFGPPIKVQLRSWTAEWIMLGYSYVYTFFVLLIAFPAFVLRYRIGEVLMLVSLPGFLLCISFAVALSMIAFQGRPQR